MISETQTQSVEVPTVEKKNGAPKRNHKKKEPKAVETVAIVANPKATTRQKRDKKQSIQTPKNDDNAESEYNKFVKLIETNPSIAEEFQSIINKHLK